MKLRGWLFVLAGIAGMSLVLFFPGAGLAAPKISITPLINVSFSVDDNYFRSDDEGERRVFTYLIQPGISFSAEWPKTEFLLDYTLDGFDFRDQEDVLLPGERSANEDDYVGHTLNFRARHRPLRRVMVGVEEQFYKTRDPAQTDEFNNIATREKYVKNRLTPLILYDFGPKFSLGLRYRNSLIDYDMETQEDSSEHRGIVDFVYNLRRDTALDLEYQYWKKRYDLNTSNYDSNQFRLILTRDFRLFSLGAGVGYQSRDFDDPTVVDISTPTYFITIGLNEVLLAGRYFEFIDFSYKSNFNDQGIDNSYFIANRFSFDVSHAFTRKLSGNLKAMYQNSNYQTFYGLTPEGALDRRTDDTWNVGMGIGYSFTEWLTFSANIGREARDSNLEGRDYNNSYFNINLNFGYEVTKTLARTL